MTKDKIRTRLEIHGIDADDMLVDELHGLFTAKLSKICDDWFIKHKNYKAKARKETRLDRSINLSEKSDVLRDCMNQLQKIIDGEVEKPEECDHHWVDARNEAVVSGEMCIKCPAVREGNEMKNDK